MQDYKIRWKRWLAGAAGLLAAYTAAGFWLVPVLIKNQIPKIGQTELARQATVGEVRFNPFTLRLQAQNLHLLEADSAPLFALGQLVVELQWRSIIRRAWSFAEIRVSAPSVNLSVAPDGKFNLAELLATLKRRPQEASTDSALPRLIIERFALEQGMVAMDDRRAGYANQLSPINFTLSHFSTLPDQDGAYSFSADSELGGRLRWKGDLSVNPIRGSGELSLENASLPELAVYLKSYSHASVASGTLAATLPYRFSYSDGKFEASLAGARLALRDLALKRTDAKDAFATLNRVDVNDINADLAQRSVTVGEFRVSGGQLAVRRDARGELDLAQLQVTQDAPAAAPGPAQAASAGDWKLALKQVIFDQLAVRAVDETVKPALRLNADQVKLELQMLAGQTGADFTLSIADAAFSLVDLKLTSGAQTPVKLARLGFTEAALDLATQSVQVGRLFAQGGQLQLTRDAAGQLTLLSLLPKAGARAPTAPVSAPSHAKAWTAIAKRVELSQFGAQIHDQATGVKVNLQDLALNLDNASSDLSQAVKFDATVGVREGGQLSAKGSVVPASGALQSDVQVKQLALAPLQPLLSQHLKLKLAGGSVSAQGRLTTGSGRAASPALHYVGDFDLAALVLNEDTGETFASWKSVGTRKLTASLSPPLLDIAELRVVEASAKLMIENDRSLNAARLLVQPPAPAPVTAPDAATQAQDLFPVRIGRLRLLNAKLDFTDLSLRPQFGAKIYELNGVVNGLSSSRSSRSQIELDGRVDEFGLARIRGELNPFTPRDNTDISVVFKNVDMVSASPYSMKFAGYRIAQGKISLDLQYKLRQSQLEGANQIVIDQLTLGERVDSPDALKLPLELAIAILKDNDGRIDLGLPVSGNMDDPQFSYGAIVWKAIGNILTKIITAPFRALGALFGLSGDKMEAIDFDAGSALLQPPEREKLLQVAQVLSKRAQLKLTVPGNYSEAADGAALRTSALRRELAQRGDIKLEVGENAGPVDQSSVAVRAVLRALYAERFGAGELEAQKLAAQAEQAAQTAASQPAPAAPAQKLAAGDPKVRDPSAFYKKLYERLEQNQPLAPDALTQLGTQRSAAILTALTQASVNPASVASSAPQKVTTEAGQPVSLKLELTAK